MSKGNYTAYQQLKPAEIKVGEFYNNWVDGYVRRGEANRAAQAKLLADQKKEIGDRFNAMKIDPYATLANFSDFAQNSFVETADFVGTQRMLADRDPANAQKYLMLAENAVADYKSLASTFGNKDFIDKANQKQQALASNDVFSESDNNEQLAILGQAIPEYRRDPNTGRMKFGLPKSGVATDEDPLEWKSTGEIVSLWTSPDEINLLKSNKSNGNNGFLDKQVFDVAKQMSDEYSRNYDGNRTNAKTWFSEERGKLWFDTNFGEFNPNNINPIVKQYAKSVLRKSINGDDAEEVFNEARTGIINSVASLVGREEKVETKDSALDTAIKQQNLINAQLEAIKKRQDIANPGGGSGSGSGAGKGDDDYVFTPNTSFLKIYNPKNKTNSYYKQEGVMMKGSAKTTDSFGEQKTVMVQTYWNPNGGKNKEGNIAFGIAVPVPGGGYTMKPLSNTGDATGASTAKRYLTNEEYKKLLKQSAVYYSDPNNRRSGELMRNGTPQRFGDDKLFDGL